MRLFDDVFVIKIEDVSDKGAMLIICKFLKDGRLEYLCDVLGVL